MGVKDRLGMLTSKADLTSSQYGVASLCGWSGSDAGGVRQSILLETPLKCHSAYLMRRTSTKSKYVPDPCAEAGASGGGAGQKAPSARTTTYSLDLTQQNRPGRCEQQASLAISSPSQLLISKGMPRANRRVGSSMVHAKC
jgi:hypothetical protein